MDTHMNDQLLDDFRRASESILVIQQDMLRKWQRLLFSTLPCMGEQAERDKTLNERWRALAVEALNKHREMVDATYKCSNELFERALRVADAKDPDEFRHIVEDMWSQAFASLRERSESQVRDFYDMAAVVFELSRKSAPAAAPAT